MGNDNLTENQRAEYVCDSLYSEYANALAICSQCGWPISRHRMAESEWLKKGPFRPADSASAEHGK